MLLSINYMPSPLISIKTPHEILFGRILNYDNFRIFKYLWYVHWKLKNHDKFHENDKRYVLFGYPLGQKVWTIFVLESKEIIIFWDAIFCEDHFPFLEKHPVSSQNSHSHSLNWGTLLRWAKGILKLTGLQRMILALSSWRNWGGVRPRWSAQHWFQPSSTARLSGASWTWRHLG